MNNQKVQETEVVMDSIYLVSLLTACYQMGRTNLMKTDKELTIGEFFVNLIREEVKNKNIDVINKDWN